MARPASLVLLLTVLLLGACGDARSAAGPSPAPSVAQTPTATANTTAATTPSVAAASGPDTATTLEDIPAEQQAAEGVLRAFTDAINRGDVDAVARLFASDASFDSVGRIYEGREQIMERFLVPEVIALGGQYELLAVQHDADTVTVEYNFRTRAGGFEHFSYRCVVRPNVIQQCVGRYLPSAAATATALPNAPGTGAIGDVPAAVQC